MVNLAQRTFDDSVTWDNLERDLTFHPAGAEHPLRLTQEQLASYNANGYLKGLPVFSDDEILEHRHYFDRLLAKQLKDGGDSYSLRRMMRFSQPYWDIAHNPIILDYVQDLLGPNIVAWGTQYFCKMPGDGKVVSWHQDASYWPLTPAHTVTMWLAVDDSDLGNGCMQVIPGTHTLGMVEFDMSGADENSVLPQKIKGAENYGKPVPFELKAGQISLHADMLIHGSEPNTSNRRRCGMTIRYAAGEVRSLDDGWTKNSTICRGRMPDDHWTDVKRPERDILDQ
ncbi:MAG: phytanoyl-CoA dioxygenase family protein [Armatimonadetes bacterium]|nr:phytanoyl-CoA dioxygenase family protein [Armatimonadota bacterium]MDE2207440.1 phytanoyl-CoA dioxygenase family protein [Armatimonadota bacterium]